MNKTVLVIGEVTRDQYQDARIELLHKGHAPKVVRSTLQDFFLSSSELVDKHAASTEVVRSGFDYHREESYPEELYVQSAEIHLEGFGDIGAIVVDAETWEHWAVYNPRYSRMIDMLAAADSPPMRWIAYPSGRVEYAGEL